MFNLLVTIERLKHVFCFLMVICIFDECSTTLTTSIPLSSKNATSSFDNNNCYNISFPLAHTREGMQSGFQTLKEKFNGTRQQFTISCTTYTPTNDTISSITVVEANGTYFEVVKGNGTVSTTIECGIGGFWYIQNFPNRPVTHNIFCETTNLTNRIASNAPVATVAPSKCKPLRVGQNYTNGMENGIVTFEKRLYGGIQEIMITCTGKDLTDESYTVLTVTSETNYLTIPVESSGTIPVSLTLLCGIDNLWHHSQFKLDTLMKGIELYQLDIVFCEVTPKQNGLPSSSSFNQLRTSEATKDLLNKVKTSFLTGPTKLRSTTASPLSASVTPPGSLISNIQISSSPSKPFNTTDTLLLVKTPTTASSPSMAPPPIPSLPSNNDTTCNKEGFKLLSTSANRSFAAQGKFGGFYKFRSRCQRLCRQSFGIFKCKAFMYEPKNHGKCSIFEHSIEGKIIEKINATAFVFRKCGITD